MPTMNYQQDKNLLKVLHLTDKMIELADHGDQHRRDASCGLLYGVLRDSAYKLRRLAINELEIHSSNEKRDIDTSSEMNLPGNNP